MQYLRRSEVSLRRVVLAEPRTIGSFDAIHAVMQCFFTLQEDYI
jgi:hypothetical protein